MVRYSDELLEEIKSKNDIIDIISEYVTLKRSGRSFFGLCPFHKEKSPSFSVSPDKQIFHCFGCGVGGDVFRFISKIENLNFKESVEMLANRAGVELPVSGNFEDDKLAKLKSRVYEVNKCAAEFYHENLYKPTAKPGQEYVKKRHLDNKTLKAFKIGYSGRFNELYTELKSKGFTEEEILASCLVNKNPDGKFIDRFRNRLMFPIFDTHERVIAFGGRVLDDSKPKYINSPEDIVYSKGRHLFAFNIARKYNSKIIIMVEGYMDAVSLHQRGIHNAVASLGTALTEAQGISYKAPLFVIGFNKERNEVIVGEQQELYRKEMKVNEVNLLLMDKIERTLDVTVKIRYASKPAEAIINQTESGNIQVIFKEPQRGITPGQSAVFYIGDVVVGGGKIQD
mgnify:CR=1 FL=1